jgi:hypothetical protein
MDKLPETKEFGDNLCDVEEHIKLCKEDGMDIFMTQDWFNQFPVKTVPSIAYIRLIRGES